MNQFFRYFIACSLLLSILSWASPTVWAQEPLMRVHLETLGELKIRGSAPMTLKSAGGGVVYDRSANYTVSYQAGGLRVVGSGGKSFVAQEKELWVVPSNQVFNLMGKRYRGYLKLFADESQAKVVAVNQIGLESYLSSVLGKEISGSWPLETRRAHAVASRTYAAYMHDHPRVPRYYDVDRSILDQVYGGTSSESQGTRQAVKETEGMMLYRGGDLLKTFYSSNCGGSTSSSEGLFPEPAPTLHPVVDPYCANAPNNYWRYEFSLGDVKRALGKLGYPAVGSLTYLDREYDKGGRLAWITFVDELQTYRISGAEFRKGLGYSNLKSTKISLKELAPGRWSVTGRGWGHGAGLCQWGAYEMGRQSIDWKQILEHYYQDSELLKGY